MGAAGHAVAAPRVGKPQTLSSLFQAGRCATATPGGWSEQPGGAQKGSHARQISHLILAQVPPGGNAAAHAARGWEGVGLAVAATSSGSC